MKLYVDTNGKQVTVTKDPVEKLDEKGRQKADRATGTGRSISGIRTAYTASDIQHARQLTGTSEGCGDQRHITAAVTTLLADREPYSSASGSPSVTRSPRPTARPARAKNPPPRPRLLPRPPPATTSRTGSDPAASPPISPPLVRSERHPMCKPSCCPPRGGSGTGAIIAVITGIILAASVLRAILGLLRLLALITAASIAAIAVIALTVWAVRAWHRRAITALQHAAQSARSAPALPPGYLLVISNHPDAGLSGRVLDSTREPLARQLAGQDDPAVVDDLIRRALRGHHT